MAALKIHAKRRRKIARSGYSVLGSAIMERALRGRKLVNRKRRVIARRRPAPKVIRRARRHVNPPKRFIGSNVALHVKGEGKKYLVASHAYCGPGPNRVTIVIPGHLTPYYLPRVGAEVWKADYDNRDKALRRDGRAGRYEHTFAPGAKVVAVRYDKVPRRTVLLLGADRPLWKEG